MDILLHFLYWLAITGGWFIWLHIAIFSHELGHAIAAKSTGMEVYLFQVGSGPKFFDRAFGKIQFRWHVLPWTGLVGAHLPNARRSTAKTVKLKRLLFIAGGTIVDVLRFLILLAITVYALLYDTYGGKFLPMLLFSLMELIVLAFSFVPTDGDVHGVMYPNDSKQWLDTIRTDYPNMFEQIYQALQPLFLRYGHSSGDSQLLDNLKNLQILSHVYVTLEQGQDFEKPMGLLTQLLVLPGLSKAEIAYILDWLTSVVIVYGQKQYCAQADYWSQRALILTPNAAIARGRRGGVLVELDRHVEAKAMLLPLVKPDNNPIDIAICSCHLAKADAYLGNIDQAKSWLNQARDVGVAFPLIMRMVETIDRELNLENV
jgi:Peptidase family M50